jgi:hypothetical protein
MDLPLVTDVILVPVAGVAIDAASRQRGHSAASGVTTRLELFDLAGLRIARRRAVACVADTTTIADKLCHTEGLHDRLSLYIHGRDDTPRYDDTRLTNNPDTSDLGYGGFAKLRSYDDTTVSHDFCAANSVRRERSQLWPGHGADGSSWHIANCRNSGLPRDPDTTQCLSDWRGLRIARAEKNEHGGHCKGDFHRCCSCLRHCSQD